MRYQIKRSLDVSLLSKHSRKLLPSYAPLHFSAINLRVKRCTGYNQLSLRGKYLPHALRNLARHNPMESQRKFSISDGFGGSGGIPLRQSLSTQATPLANDSSTAGPKSHTIPQIPKAIQHGKSNSISGMKQEIKESPQSNSEKTAMGNPPTQAPTGLPDFIIRRNQLFDELKKKHDAEMLRKPRPEIEVFLDLGRDKNGAPIPPTPVPAKAWESTPGSFLRHVKKELSAEVVIAKIDGEKLWDLDRPLEYSCRVNYLPFSSAEGRNVFWHSSAHVLGEAAECQYNCLLSHGPPVEQGFFYDMAIADGSVPVYN